MVKIAIRSLVLILGLALTAAVARADEPQAGAKLEEKLLGTWKLISARYGGREAKFPEGVTMLKHVTSTQFMWATYDGEGKLTRAAGGGYMLTGGVYEETPEYGISRDFDLIKGKTHTFQCKIEGNRWYNDGKLSSGLTIEEVWERVTR